MSKEDNKFNYDLEVTPEKLPSIIQYIASDRYFYANSVAVEEEKLAKLKLLLEENEAFIMISLLELAVKEGRKNPTEHELKARIALDSTRKELKRHIIEQIKIVEDLKGLVNSIYFKKDTATILAGQLRSTGELGSVISRIEDQEIRETLKDKI